ncbi:hypothetical protein [Lysinibacter cavernae]|uniref:Uncharacterized protein n=1 Tax=Lysinibacter cavernae TaxID=1640652 RepID=A0A7X5R3E0_9MICO|nr:hypothetical protein [Lysinibacter cavernae]NIH54913.1 hypothetical protein [Lysinibacter cavernae]
MTVRKIWTHGKGVSGPGITLGVLQLLPQKRWFASKAAIAGVAVFVAAGIILSVIHLVLSSARNGLEGALAADLELGAYEVVREDALGMFDGNGDIEIIVTPDVMTSIVQSKTVLNGCPRDAECPTLIWQSFSALQSQFRIADLKDPGSSSWRCTYSYPRGQKPITGLRIVCVEPEQLRLTYQYLSV